MEPILSTLEKIGCRVEPCGSRVTCSPPPIDTDADYLVQILPASNIQDAVASVVNELSGSGFQWEGSEHYQDAAGEFMSWRSDDNVNFIVTADPIFAERHRAATALCKRLNLLDKQDRIALFQAVLYGVEWNGETWAEMKAKRSIMSVDKMLADLSGIPF